MRDHRWNRMQRLIPKLYGEQERHIQDHQDKTNPKGMKRTWPFSLVLCVTKSWNHSGWKRPLRSMSLTIKPALPSLSISHVYKHHTYIFLERFQRPWLQNFPGQPVAMLDHPFSEGFFPNVESKFPLAQLEYISVCPFVTWGSDMQLCLCGTTGNLGLPACTSASWCCKGRQYLNIHDLVLCALVEMCELMNAISSVLKYNCPLLSKISCWDLLCCCYNAAALFLTNYLSISVKNQLFISLDPLFSFISVNIQG